VNGFENLASCALTELFFEIIDESNVRDEDASWRVIGWVGKKLETSLIIHH
jgi:hypothetical protein